MIKILRYLTIILLISSSLAAFPQTQGVLGRRFFSNWSIGIAGGPNVFFGDLKVNDFWPVSTNMNEWRYAGTFSLTKQVSHVFAFRAQVMYGEISGTKRFYKDGTPCNQYFDGSILEYNLNTTINISNLFTSYKPNRKFFVYGTLGVGLSTWDTKRKDLVTHEIDTTGTGSLQTMALVGIGGIGAYYSFGDKVNLGIEWTLHGVNSDDIDHTRGVFKYDAYSMAAITLIYNFNRKNPGKLQAAKMGKQLGPMPAKPEPDPLLKSTTDKPAGTGTATGKLPSLPTPLGFPVRDTVKKETPPADTLLFTSEPVDTTGISDEESGPYVQGISYRVQIFAFETNEYPAETIQDRFRLNQPVYKEFSEGWYRYTVGTFTTFKSAKAYMNKMRKIGIRDAFIARYEDGIRIASHPKH
jgi:hypothetical protein